jgi:hypothetical protein
MRRQPYHDQGCKETTLHGRSGRMVSLWPIASGDALTASPHFRGIADMAGPASLPGPVAIDTREPRDGTVNKGLRWPSLNKLYYS